MDRQLTHKPEVDNKYFKAANYVDVLSRLLAANQAHTLYVLNDYPIVS